jgi:hypothetical protein
LLSGRAFTVHDDKSSPRVAIVNQQFVRKLFGSAAGAIGSWYKLKDGTRIQVVGIAEDGKYGSLTEDPLPAMFFSHPAVTLHIHKPRRALPSRFW